MQRHHCPRIAWLIGLLASLVLLMAPSVVANASITSTSAELFGSGEDGNFGGGDPNSVRTALSRLASAGQRTLAVVDSSRFNLGKEVLIIQVQGAGAGRYEFGVLISKGPGSITLANGLRNTYVQDSASRAQVLWVPHFANVSGNISTGEWDNSTGGIVAFRALSVSGVTVNVSTKGFKGGYGNDSAIHRGNICYVVSGQGQAQQGTSPLGIGGCNKVANGGGGGGAGNPVQVNNGEFGSGGGGGYGWPGGNGQGPAAGAGGQVYGTADLSTIFLGSGGGGGTWGTNPYGGGRLSIQGNDYSGQGAGATIIAARQIAALNIFANGQVGGNSIDAYGGYGGGGGSGGSIKIIGGDVSLGTIQALGGAGGSGRLAQGGPGGAGRIRIEYCTSLAGATNPFASVAKLPCNAPPVAADDSYRTLEDRSLTIPAAGVLGNDRDPESSPLTATLARHPGKGSVTLNANGSFSYTPYANAFGLDSFAYQASDGQALSNVATVTITIDPVNDPPTANADSYTANEDQPLHVAAPGVLTNDADVERDRLSARLMAAPTNGMLTLNPDGSFVYVPRANFYGTDRFSYAAHDGQVASNTQLVTINVAPINDAPVAYDQALQTAEDTELAITLTAADVEANALSYRVVTPPAHGTLSGTAPNLTYRPAANYYGPDSFTFTAHDGQAVSNPATIAITVNPVNDAPICAPTTLTTDEDTLGVTSPVCSDVDGDPLTYQIVEQGTKGTASIADLRLQYQPNLDANGSDTFSYRASDGQLISVPALVSVTINPINDVPVAVVDAHSVNEDTPLVVSQPGLLANDTDVEGDALTVTLVAGPAHGRLTLNADGSFTYTPALNYHGLDSFSYRANDGQAASDLATVTITVNPVNDAPVAVNDSATTRKNTGITISILANDYDVDGDPLNIIIIADSISKGAQIVVNPNGTITYYPKPGFHDTDTFRYKLNDGTIDSNEAMVTIDVTKDKEKK